MSTTLGLATMAQVPTLATPSGIICLWSGLVANIPAGWALCDGQAGTPDLRGMFVKGALAGANPGVTGGAATHGHANHAVTQPGAHANHAVTQPSAHAVTQAAAHAAHAMTQAAGHAAHAVTQAAAHVVTQPVAHAALGTHAHELPFTKVAGATGVFRMLASSIFGVGTSRAPESQSAAPVANTTAAAVALSQAVTAGTPSAHAGTAVDAHAGAGVDAHSGHAGAAVDAHSAHAGAGVDAHSGSGVDGHSAHAGVTVDAHQAASSEPAFYSLAFIIKT